jgi:hypothetical protein
MSFVTVGSAAGPKLRDTEIYEGLGLADPIDVIRPSFFRSEVPILNLSFVESHLTREFVDPVSENLHQHTMGLLGQVFSYSLTQKHQVVPLPPKLCAVGLPNPIPRQSSLRALTTRLLRSHLVLQVLATLQRCRTLW